MNFSMPTDIAASENGIFTIRGRGGGVIGARECVDARNPLAVEEDSDSECYVLQDVGSRACTSPFPSSRLPSTTCPLDLA